MAVVVSELKISGGWAVAARSLVAGQVVLQETPLVTGPGRAGKPVCLSCYSTVDAEFYCSCCGWQLCGSHCEEAVTHRLECSQLKEKGIECLWEDVEDDTFCMDFLGAFRLLLALQDKPQLRKELLERDMQTERRQGKYNSRYYVDCEQAIMKYIRDTCGMSSFKDQEILNALGLMEMYGSSLQNGAKALYSTWLLLAHSCTPNTYSTINTDGSITVRASVPIKEGEPLTRCLVDPLWCSQARRRELDRTFLIDCTCRRCADPSELGTCLNGLHSEEHGEAVFLPSKPLQEDGGPWLSPSLPGVQLPGPACSQKLELLTRKCDEGLAEMGGSTMGLEMVLNTRGEWDVLPKSGQVLLGVKHRLVAAWQDQGLEVEKLKTKVEYCRELLAVLARVHPGRNYTSAMLHFQAAAAAQALAEKGDSSLATEGASHAASAAAMCEGEEGNMYQQLREYVLQLAKQLQA